MSANLEQHDDRFCVVRVGGELKKSELDAAQSAMGSTSTGLHWRGSSQRTGEVFSRNSRIRGTRVARRVSAESIYAIADKPTE